MSTGKVVRSVFLVGDELLRMEELAICPSLHLVDNRGLQVNEQGSRNMLPCTCFTEERVECILRNPNRGVTARQRAKNREIEYCKTGELCVHIGGQSHAYPP